MEKTIISATNEREIKNNYMSPREILLFLKNGAVYRDFKNVILKVYPDENVGKILAGKLAELNGKNIDAVSRSVRNWLSGRNLPQRDQLFQICFALGLDDGQANMVISFASESGIHYRNPQEIIYAYCLRFGHSWDKACELSERILPRCGKYENVKMRDGNIKKYTGFLKKEFYEEVKDEESLESFIINNLDNFAVLHMTAYTDFIKMITYLQNPDKDYGDNYDDGYYDYIKKHQDEFDDNIISKFKAHEEGMAAKSVACVVEEFMRMHVPENNNRRAHINENQRNYSYIQEVIKKNWPSESIINKIKNQEIDVSRKVMILLHLLTEEFENALPLTEDETDYCMPDILEQKKENADELMEIRLNQLNLFLDSYGMNRIDPGNPFDCLVMYALMASYSDECDDYMSERLEEMLGLVFEEDGEIS